MQKSQLTKLILTVLIISLPCLIAAQTTEPAPLVTDRPDQTESPLTVPLESFQIESGFIYARARQTEEALSTDTESFDRGKPVYFPLQHFAGN
jgi:hypothetical protein